MAITVSNRLDGTDGQEVSDSSLAASAVSGTVVVADASTRAVYDESVQVADRTSIRVATGHHRDGATSGAGAATPRLVAPLPDAPWTARFYLRGPDMQAAGHGTDEVRWVAALGSSHGLLAREESGGGLQLRLKPDGLASATITADSFTGTAPQIDQVLRVELTYDGTDLKARLYEVDETAPAITYQFDGITITGPDLALTGYRFRDGVLLQPGANDAADGGTLVEDRQNQLLVWDPDCLPEWGADGDYGGETTTAVEDFQTDYGLDPVDGEIGPETGAALDLMVDLAESDPTPPELWVSHLAVDDTATVIGGVQADVTVTAEAAITVSAAATVTAVEGDTTAVAGAASLSGHVSTTKRVRVPVVGTVAMPGGAQASKRVTTTADAVLQSAPAAPAAKTVTTAAVAAPVVSAAAGIVAYENLPFPIAVRVELRIDGAWTDITGDVRTGETITIKRGLSEEAAAADASSMTLTLNNRHGKYSPRNPSSPYYAKVGRNTPVRVRVRTTRWVTRFVGEVSTWPARWDLSGADVWVPLEASGILRRLGAPHKPLKSFLRRWTRDQDYLAYWPLEDGERATRAASDSPALPGAAVEAGFGGDDSLPGSAPVLSVSESEDMVLRCYVPAGTGSTWSVQWYMRPDARVEDADGGRIVWIYLGGGSLFSLTLVAQNEDFSPAGRIDVYGGPHPDESEFATINEDIGVPDDFYGHWGVCTVTLTASGSQTHLELSWRPDGRDEQTFDLGWHSETFTRVTQVDITANSVGSSTESLLFPPQDWSYGHLVVHNGAITSAPPGNGFGGRGESAARRVQRLCEEEGVPLVLAGPSPLTTSTPMGPQGTAQFLELLGDAVVAESAGAATPILTEQRDELGLHFRARRGLYNQAPALELDYSAGEVSAPFEPVDDDQQLVNDVIADRDGGSDAHVSLEQGPLSVQAPPDGVGRYDASVTLNVAGDHQLADAAGWRVHLGTVDEARYPQLNLNLANARMRVLAPDIITLDSGSRVTIANTPPWLPPGAVDMVVDGYTEEIGLHAWNTTINASPGSPWTVATIADGHEPDSPDRADTAGSELSAEALADDGSLAVDTTAGPSWTTDADQFPFDIACGGEVMRVTDIIGSGNPQSFVVERAVNGVVKAHPAGTDVRLARPAVTAL